MIVAIKVWLEKWADILWDLYRRSGTYRIGVVVLLTAAFSAGMVWGASTAEALETSTRCSPDGDAVIVEFTTDQSGAWWSLHDGGSDVRTFGETDFVPLDRSSKWTQTVAIEPGVEYVWFVQTYDLGERLEYSWEKINIQETTEYFTCQPGETEPPSNEVIEPVFYDPTPSPYSFLEWIRDVYRRALLDCSRIGAFGYVFCIS